MLAFLLLLALCHSSKQCEDSNNLPDKLVNKDCNYAGNCYKNRCDCCNSGIVDDYCKNELLTYPGEYFTTSNVCDTRKNYYAVTWGYLYSSGSVDCPNDGVSSANPDYIDETIAVIRPNYTGIVLPQPCKVCTGADPCTLESERHGDKSITDGTLVQFGTDVNTYYDASCGTGILPGSDTPCAANWDKGARAKAMLEAALDVKEDFVKHFAALKAEIKSSDILGATFKAFFLTTTLVQVSLAPTSPPTLAPTKYPTRQPTEFEIKGNKCMMYRNEEPVFIGGGSSCRANINESWTGGRTCNSPYIICLPQENTPSLSITGTPYFNDTHRYKVDECKKECADDQRCMGFEFVADTASKLGNCTLLDDIPIEIENEYLGPFEYSEAEDDLHRSNIGFEALCFQKSDKSCNPYFEAEDLNDTMLNCYCPNNRKGSYTKRVKRTVATTRYCYNDSSVEERIKKAQANRMFHLCENWCLFETLNPEQESWYWDPWKQCYRETYSAVGAHTGYCDRVIRNPNSIEFQFVSYRKQHFCGVTEQPTSSPVSDGITTWTLSEILESCDEACSRTGARCAAPQTMITFPTEETLLSAFEEAGATCQEVIMNGILFAGWALPGIRGDSVCVNRYPRLMTHLGDLNDCNRKLGGEWRRLCACY